MALSEKKYPCPCCGYLTLDEEPGNYDICPVCYWEDDPVQRREPDEPGGANGDISLNQAKRNYKKYGAVEKRFIKKVRKPKREEMGNEQ